jgi:CubicO group peptidase (beta-lactamase class C family)
MRQVDVSDTATGAPMSVDDQTRIGSVTKTFTRTAVLQLVDQGRNRLSDPISLYADRVPSGDVITLDLLGRMHSGLADYAASDGFLIHIGTIPVMEPVPNLDVATPLSLALVSDGGPFSSVCWGERTVFDYPDGTRLGVLVACTDPRLQC